MSEKRFYLDEEDRLCIHYNGRIVACVGCRETEAEKIVDLLNEQQATIRRLQDLCGESDGENAKLRIENKRLEKEVNLLKPTNIEQYEQIQKLQQENRELRKELGDCEKFRYTVFKRLNEEYIKDCSIK